MNISDDILPQVNFLEEYDSSYNLLIDGLKMVAGNDQEGYLKAEQGLQGIEGVVNDKGADEVVRKYLEDNR